tara:strand:- start:1067 stop:3451 length:2385 start_codon:yes stop_codon:yes gene_type:complete
MMSLEELNEKLDKLLAMHGDMSKVINKLRAEIQVLNESEYNKSKLTKIEQPLTGEDENRSAETAIEAITSTSEYIPKQRVNQVESSTHPVSQITTDHLTTSKPKIDLEKLIGENLINKVGILILIIGVAIGAKYSVENNLINPLTRIILGYITGVSLLITGLKLKNKYSNYSAVLVSGAMAIFYFITFFAYSFYDIFNQMIAFGLMVIFTIFTVIASLNYNKQVIAHIGLIGAIAVPFLLSDGSGNTTFLFSYLLLINIGIFFISLKKQWNILFYNAFGLTWIVFLVWLTFSSEISRDFNLAFGFATAFFLLFYAIFITYKVKNIEKYKKGDIIILLLNSMIFYGVGYSLLDSSKFGSSWLGLFTIANAIVHFGVAKLIQTKKSSDRNLFYLVIGLVLVFLTMAIPVQLDGSYVTIMWMGMTALLFWIGRTKKVPFYEYLSYGLLVLACISLAQDWEAGYHAAYYGSILPKTTPIINTVFLASMVSVLATGLINWIARKPEHLDNSTVNHELIKFTKIALPIVFLGILYMAFFNEIQHYFDQCFEDSTREVAKNEGSGLNIIRNYSIPSLSHIWLLIYTMIFMSGLLHIISSKIKNRTIHTVAMVASLVLLFSFLTGGLFDISELRKTYIDQTNADYYDIGIYYIWIRYLSITVFLGFFWLTYKMIKEHANNSLYKTGIEVILASIILWLLSSELIHWFDFSESRNEYGLGVSILWGAFSASIIAFGIWKKQKHLRLLGIAIFGVTLVKLFFYDLASLSTISKTIVLVALGVLLLATSFLYNKYTIDEGTDDEH